MAVVRADRIIADITSGALDGQLDLIVKAITKKIQSGQIATRWRIECLGLNVAQDNLTLDEAWKIEQATDTDWHEIEPTSSATHFRAMVTVLLDTRLGMQQPAIDELIATLTVDQAAKGITRELLPADNEEGRAPLATSAAATT